MHPLHSFGQGPEGGLRRRKLSQREASDENIAPPPGKDPDSIVLTFVVPPDCGGMRLDRFLQRRIPRLSRTRAQQVIRSCAVHADGRARRPSDIVRDGEVVLVVRERFVEPEVPRDFDVVFEDDAVLALAKPAGLPMHRTATYHRNTLSYVLRERYGMSDPPRIAHRLDRETSGLVLCAKTREAERVLKEHFERHRVHKRYLAIVRGVPSPRVGTIDLPLAAVKEGLHVCMEVSEEGASAMTRYRVRAVRAGHALVELSPKSGRQHQLRVHLAAIGTPIVGDKLYGPEGTAPFLEMIETGMTPELLQRLGHPRQALHAHSAAFAHPSDGRMMRLTARLPADMHHLWHSL